LLTFEPLAKINFMSQNVFGQPLIACSRDPLTGFYRDGCCNTGPQDRGQHTVCAVMTDSFLQFSQARGNNLITPRPQYNFPGLKPGDRWCLCASRWKEAYEAGVAPPVVLEATAEATLEFIELETLIEFAVKDTEHSSRG
jgi:uncharacterized protein (DUF2237 family)